MRRRAFLKNIEIFMWHTEEADRRGIWIIQFFYNIHLSHAFARKHDIPFQHREPSELTARYTRYCVSEFIGHYPNVGLMMCLGEKLKDEHDAKWLTEVILPGVKDGMKTAGLTREPPVIIRAHSRIMLSKTAQSSSISKAEPRSKEFRNRFGRFMEAS